MDHCSYPLLIIIAHEFISRVELFFFIIHLVTINTFVWLSMKTCQMSLRMNSGKETKLISNYQHNYRSFEMIYDDMDRV